MSIVGRKRQSPLLVVWLGPVRGLLLGNCYAQDKVVEMLGTSFQILYGACFLKSKLCIGGAREFWWVSFSDSLPSPTWYGDGFIFFHGGVLKAGNSSDDTSRGTPFYE